MKKTAILLFFSALFYTNSFSQTKQESIKELFHLMKQDSLIDKMFGSVFPGMMAQMAPKTATAADKQKMEESMKSAMKVVQNITKRMVNEDMVLIYDKYFTEQEIADFATFYKTPSAQKMLTSMPDIQKDIMTIMMQKYMPEIQKSIKESLPKPKPAAPKTN